MPLGALLPKEYSFFDFFEQLGPLPWLLWESGRRRSYRPYVGEWRDVLSGRGY